MKYFADKMLKGVKFNNIKVDKKYGIIVDGNHRHAASKVTGTKLDSDLGTTSLIQQKSATSVSDLNIKSWSKP